MAQKLPTPPKPYTPKELSTEELVPMIGNEGKTYVKFPIRNSVYTPITGSLEALGIRPLAINRTGKMPVPQKKITLVGWASCPSHQLMKRIFARGLLKQQTLTLVDELQL